MSSGATRLPQRRGQKQRLPVFCSSSAKGGSQNYLWSACLPLTGRLKYNDPIRGIGHTAYVFACCQASGDLGNREGRGGSLKDSSSWTFLAAPTASDNYDMKRASNTTQFRTEIDHFSHNQAQRPTSTSQLDQIDRLYARICQRVHWTGKRESGAEYAPEAGGVFFRASFPSSVSWRLR